MPAYGIDEIEKEWICDYLFDRHQLVKIDEIRSNTKAVLSGVPQGSILGPLLFTIFFNDFAEHMTYCDTVKYADDTVIYYSHADYKEIEDKINIDLNRISTFFDDNELIINLKKGKSESMLFGTAKRLANIPSEFNCLYRGTKINQVKEYKYLGNYIDSNLSFKANFEKAYKKASARLRLLEKMRPYLTKYATIQIYKMMIIPILTYSGILCLEHNKYQLDRFKSLENRSRKIIGEQYEVSEIRNQIIMEACLTVRKCLDGSLCSNFRNYFEVNKHHIGTRNNGLSLRLPKVKLSVAKQSFCFPHLS